MRAIEVNLKIIVKQTHTHTHRFDVRLIGRRYNWFAHVSASFRSRADILIESGKYLELRSRAWSHNFANDRSNTAPRMTWLMAPAWHRRQQLLRIRCMFMCGRVIVSALLLIEMGIQKHTRIRAALPDSCRIKIDLKFPRVSKCRFTHFSHVRRANVPSALFHV